jgi:hypothetical protein
MGANRGVAEALRRELTRVDAGGEIVSPPEPLAGGFSADLFAFAVGVPPRALVLRLLRDDQAAAREARMQSHVAALGYPAPRVGRTMHD